MNANNRPIRATQCHYCGSGDLHAVSPHGLRTMAQITCFKCGASGPAAVEIETAWDRFTAPVVQERVFIQKVLDAMSKRSLATFKISGNLLRGRARYLRSKLNTRRRSQLKRWTGQ